VGGREHEGFEVTKVRLEELREKVRAVEWLNREEQDEMFRGMDQLLRDNQALADGLNDWRDRCREGVNADSTAEWREWLEKTNTALDQEVPVEMSLQVVGQQIAAVESARNHVPFDKLGEYLNALVAFLTVVSGATT
jgi:hypothetical protein